MFHEKSNFYKHQCNWFFPTTFEVNILLVSTLKKEGGRERKVCQQSKQMIDLVQCALELYLSLDEQHIRRMATATFTNFNENW